MKKLLAMTLAVLLIVSVLPASALAASFDSAVTGDYFTVISENRYTLAPGASEVELVLNNDAGNDRKVVHYFEVDAKNPNIEVLPGYYGIDKLDPDNLPLNGIEDKAKFWKAEQLTKTVAYYESLGYNVVGAMNTALAYDSDAPYGYMVMNGVVLGTPEVHKGAQTYLAIDAEGNCELRSMTTPLTGNEVTAISANFGWLVKDGKLQKTTVERTSSDASRSMIGIKADGSLIFCQVDGRNAPTSSGLSDYEMGEMMLALGCVNAVNCDGGGSSTFVSKREGETSNTMRSIPSDGSERATINSVILVSKAKSTGEFDHAVLGADYNYYAPLTSAAMKVTGVDAAGSPAELPTEGITWGLSDASFGTVADGVFTSNGKKGDVTILMFYNGALVGEKTIHIVDPDKFALTLDETVLPYGKSMDIDFACTYGADDWAVCVDGAYTLALSDTAAATLNGNTLKATSDESVVGVNVTATYIPNPAVTDVLKVTYGKGSELVWNFEDGNLAGFMGFQDAKKWSQENGVTNTLVGEKPLDGQFNAEIGSTTFIADASKGDPVRNGKYALAWSLDYTDADYAGWSYNVLFNVNDRVVFRDVENGKNATTLGMWLYIPEGAAGLSFQSQFYGRAAGATTWGCHQAHFMFTTVSGARKNLNSCSEADIPESRWVYVSIDLTGYDYLSTMEPHATASNVRSPSFIRCYIKPTVPAVHTFYIDDITLDYSSAVDDRVLPTIGDVCYTPADQALPLNQNATVIGNTMAFSATIADNMKLDYTTGKILVDGVELPNITCSGKVLASENVTLLPGKHVVTFEVKDHLGNLARVTRNIIVEGEPTISLGGHNDSGLRPEYDSIYYVDLDVANIANINSVITTLKLQTANTWELQGIVVADGFKVSYSLNTTKDELTLVIERNGEDVDASATKLISIPVRLWLWDAINNVTGLPVAPETQFATGYCPIVTVDCKVLSGEIKYTNSTITDTFGGNISVETMINDTVNPWHKHDAELTVLNKDASCTVDGYEGRTYCEGCKSVIDWGTVIPATGHNYVDGKCEHCGKIYTFTGLKEEDGNWYYYVSGKRVSGWQLIGNDWHYFDLVTCIGAQGDLTLEYVPYNFVNGKLTSGVWVKTLYGMRYYYGPDCYNDRGSWRVIDGKEYFFEWGDTIAPGYQLVVENQVNLNWYFFNEDGTCDKDYKVPDGFYTDRRGYAYCKDGKALTGLQQIDGKYYYFNVIGYAQKGQLAGRLYGDDYAAYTGLLEKDGVLYYYKDGRTGPYGLVEVDGKYYFSNWGGVVTTGTHYISATHCDLPVGTYTFGEDGAGLNGMHEKDGNRYLYVNGARAAEGMYKIGDEYFAANWEGKLQANGKFYVSKTYCDLPVGNYTFGADGHMLNGVEEVDGKLYLYINGTTSTEGLFKVDGEYYYATWGGLLKTNGRFYISKSFCDLGKGNYSFAEDGHMLDGVEEVDGKLYLYKNGTTVTEGLYKVDGEYYYATWGGLLRTNGRYYVSTSFCDLGKGNYDFAEDGHMLDGVEEVNGKLYLYKNGTTVTEGLFKVDGKYYYATWGGLLRTNGRYYVSTTFCDLPVGNYDFAEDGHMLNGVEEVNGKLYLYNKGTTVTEGLYKVDGKYYYATWGGELKVDGRFYVGTSFCDLGKGNYSFGADGAMLDGFVTIDGVKYYYENGTTKAPGLICVDGDYYFVDWGGVIVTNKYFFVWEGNGYTIPKAYNFDAEGRFYRA